MKEKDSRAGMQGAHSWIRQNILGLVAIFIALSGTALATNVASNHAAQSAKSRRGPRGPAGPPGPQGLQGLEGLQGPATGPAGGALSGSYPNPSLAAGSVATAQLADGAVSAAKLQSPGGFTSMGLGDDGGGVCFVGDNAWESLNTNVNNIGSYFRDPWGIVHLRGIICKNNPPSGTLFTLPSGFRPQFQEVLAAVTQSGTGRVDVNSDGTIVPNGLSSGNWVSLDGLSFSCAGSGGPGCP